MRIKGGQETHDPRLDRVVHFDERSRAYGIDEVAPATIRTRSWPCGAFLDQGQEGACVGFSWAHERAAEPVPDRSVTNDVALGIYADARKVDEWPGEDYSGTSVLAGAKTSQARGWLAGYRWAFSIDELLRALSHEGPAVLGIPWLEGMFSPRPSGLLEVSGDVAGGHAILARGVILKPRLRGERALGTVVRLRNSWGRSWGAGGDCFVHVEDLERLLKQDGEACVPQGRRR